MMFEASLPSWMVPVCVTGVVISMFWRASRGPQKIGARTSVVLLGVGVLALSLANEQGDAPATVGGMAIAASFFIYLLLYFADYVSQERQWLDKRRGKK
mgnify:CR=1 FL=1